MPQSILIIEDDAAARLSMVVWLRSAGFGVVQTEDAHGGLEAFLRDTPDLVLLDLGIAGPDGEDGMGLLRRMKAARPAVPVIIVSGRTHISDAIEAFKAGAWDYVAKPITSMDVFINGLHNCLAQARLQQRVHETQEHLYQLIQNLPVIIFSINANLEFEFLNQSTEAILGYPPHEILESPRPFLRCIVPEDRRKFLTTLRSSFRPGSPPFRLDFRFTHKDGYQVFLQAQSLAYPAQRHRPVDRLEGMIMDVTRHSYLDKLLLQNEKLNMLNTMTEEVAHEIRNPLVSLGGFARKLRATFPTAVETEVILQECTRLERLVQRITAYQEPLAVSRGRCSVPATVALGMRLLSRRIESRGIRHDIRIADSLPAVWGDQELLHRIFMTVIAQAVDVACNHGHIGIEAHHSHDLVHVSVTIRPVRTSLPAPNALLLPFGEAENPSLSLCYRLLEYIHGHLHVDQAGDQTRITVTLPKYRLAEDARGADAPHEALVR